MTPRTLKIPRQLLKIDYLSQEKIKKLLDFIPSIRDKTLFTLMYYYGLRRVEASEMRLADINLTKNLIFIGAAKNGNSGWYHLHEKIKPLFQSYLQERKKSVRKSEFLFISRSSERLSPRQIAFLFQNYAKKVRYPIKMQHPHVLRHSIAVHMASSGVNVSTVQMHLRHKSINNTMIYFKIISSARAELQKSAFEQLMNL